MKFVFLLLMILSLAQWGNAQDLDRGFKNWYSFSLGLKVSDRVSLSYSRLHSIDFNPMRQGFFQSTLGGSYKFDKHNSLILKLSQSGFRWSSSYARFGLKPSLYRMAIIFRIALSFRHKHKLIKSIKWLRMRHAFDGQIYFPQLDKYHLRFIYTLKVYYYSKKAPLKISPFIENAIFYYMNGKPIPYYDETGAVIAYNSPNDFHRYRLKTGFSFKPFLDKIPNLGITMYYALQFEFNSGLFPNRRINYIREVPSVISIDPNGPNLQETFLPFNNYMLFGVSLSYKITPSSWKKKEKE